MNLSSKSRVLGSATTAVFLWLIAAVLQPCSAQEIFSKLPPDSRTAASVDGPSSSEVDAPASSVSSTASSQRSAVSAADRIRTFNRYAPIRESWTTLDLGTKYVRAVFGGLEQGASFGLGVQFSTADKLPGVELRATLITSALLYRRFEGEVYVPKLFTENTHADLWFDYLRRTKDNFYGIGPRIPNTSMTNYDIERRSYNGSLYHNFSRQMLLGGYVGVTNSSTYRGQRDTDPPIDQLFSGDPNTLPVTSWAPALMINSTILSYGGYAQYDLRDNAAGLTKGAYLYGRVGLADGLKNRNRFADYAWLEAEADARGYIPLGSDRTSLALRAFAQFRDPRGGSQVPFYDMAYVGGRMHVRGFRDYRFRGNNVALGSAELRQTIWSQREDRGLDVFAFGDAGQVWGDNRSTTDPAVLANQDFSSSNYRASVGGGFQYRYSKSLAGRLEMGHSHERNLIYFSVSRGF